LEILFDAKRRPKTALTVMSLPTEIFKLGYYVTIPASPTEISSIVPKARAGFAAGDWLAWAEAAQGGFALDIVLFAASAVFAAITMQNKMLPSHGEWGRVAVWGYAAALVFALAASIARSAGVASRFTGIGGRAALTTLVFAATALLPLILQAMQRADGRLDRAQPEVTAIEIAGKRLLHSGTPYLNFETIAALPPGARLDAYLPYQPGMVLYGLPSAFAGAAWWTDPRFWFVATLVLTLLPAIYLMRCPDNDALDRLLLRAVQAMSILPICALTIATGGDDLPVLGLCVLALTFAARDRFGAAGLAVGLGAALKLFAWPVAAVLLALAATRSRAIGLRYMMGAVLLPAAALIPALLIDPDALVENIIRFPLGWGLVNSPAQSPLPGHLIAAYLPDGRVAATALLLLTGAAFGVWLLRQPPRSIARAAAVTAFGLLVAIMLIPATRFGYFLYPIGLTAWATVLSKQ
jgi:Glycosyltransferase family 87